MITLKELTWDAHKRAEQTKIMCELLADTIHKDVYCDLVYTKYEIYRTIEDRVQFESPDLRRAQAALNDWQVMGCHLPKCIPALDEYLTHVRSCLTDQIWGHVYVHYLAPLYGGQIIKKKIAHRLPVQLYEFTDPAAAIAEVRKNLNVNLVAEANLAFESVITYYEHLWEQHYPS